MNEHSAHAIATHPSERANPSDAESAPDPRNSTYDVNPLGERCLTFREAADFLRVHKRTIQNEIKRGNLLPFLVAGRPTLTAGEICRYVATRMAEAEARRFACDRLN